MKPPAPTHPEEIVDAKLRHILCALTLHRTPHDREFEKRARAKLRELAINRPPGREAPQFYLKCDCGRVWRKLEPDWNEPW